MQTRGRHDPWNYIIIMLNLYRKEREVLFMYKLYDWKEKIDESELQDIVKILNNNGVIIFPTETVYGIGGNATSLQVIDKVYNAKKRPRAKAVNIIVSNTKEIEKYAVINSELEKKIIETFMPGPITIILEKKAGFGDDFTLDDGTIGVRVPDNEIMRAILNKIDFPLIAPSANISNEPSGTNVNQIIDDFKDSVDAIIDGGEAKIGLSSTIIKVENDEVKILRAGKITKEEILSKIAEI